MIELPYKETGFRMIVVLPNEVDGLPSVLEKAAEKGLLSDVYRLRPAGRHIDLDIPKFDIRTKINFNDILPKVRYTLRFNPDTDKLEHKQCYVETEAGTSLLLITSDISHTAV